VTQPHTGADLRAVIDVAQQATEPHRLDTGAVYAVHTSSGDVRTIDLTGDQYRDRPARKAGTATVRDARSFLDYYTKHYDDASEVYADVTKLSVTAVLDAHEGADGGPRWGRHRLVLALRHTPAWTAWTEKNSKLLGQEEFAEFIEDHLPEIVDPPAANMLEIAQSIQATTKTSFKSGTRLDTGQRQLVYEETGNASAGKRGQLTIPETFAIGLTPFEGAAAYRLNARLRYRIADGTLRIGYKLDRPEDTIATAFADVTASLLATQERPSAVDSILNGTPA